MGAIPFGGLSAMTGIVTLGDCSFHLNDSNSLVGKQNTNIKLCPKDFPISINNAGVIKVLYALLNYIVFSPIIRPEVGTNKVCHPATSLFQSFVQK